jgi:hypothetical protein
METQQDALQDIFKPAILDPELEQYRTRDAALGWDVIKHPLVFSVPHFPGTENLLNQQLTAKKKAIAEALEENNLDRYVWMHERPYRLEAFLIGLGKGIVVSDQDYNELLHSMWIDSENIWQHKKAWKQLFTDKRFNRDLFMDEEEREKLASLPDLISVYRGCTTGKNEKGMSWTLSRVRAEWFANRFSSRKTTSKVIAKQVKKSKVLAYSNSRNEEEIILL